MKKPRATLCLALVIVGMFSTSALATQAYNFSFTFTGSGVKYLDEILKATNNTYAAVEVTQSSYTYKYAVATNKASSYVTNWKSITGKTSRAQKLPYTINMSTSYKVRLHCSSTSSNGTSTTRGTWTP